MSANKTIRVLLTLELEFIADDEAMLELAESCGAAALTPENTAEYARAMFDESDVLTEIENDLACLSVETGEVQVNGPWINKFIDSA